MKLGLVTKLDNRKKTTSKNFDDDLMPQNCDVIVIYLIYSQFGSIQKPDAGRIVHKTYIFISSNLLVFNSNLTKTENQTKKSLIQLSHYCFV